MNLDPFVLLESFLPYCILYNGPTGTAAPTHNMCLPPVLYAVEYLFTLLSVFCFWLDNHSMMAHSVWVLYFCPWWWVNVYSHHLVSNNPEFYDDFAICLWCKKIILWQYTYIYNVKKERPRSLKKYYRATMTLNQKQKRQTMSN